MNTDHVSLVFPGQGFSSEVLYAHFNAVRTLPESAECYHYLMEALGSSPNQLYNSDPLKISDNKVSSLLMTFISVTLLHHLRSSDQLSPFANPKAVAGYSVGQLSALYAAGAIGIEQLFQLVQKRASIMDRAICDFDTGMLGIVGVAEQNLEAICAKVNAAGGNVAISNYNSTANLTIAGSVTELEEVAELVKPFTPKVIERLPVAGAWHSSYLSSAVEEFRRELADILLFQPKLPIIDNVTGEWLPVSAEAAKHQLASHLAAPVHWYRGLRTMIDSGTETFVEIGASNMLSTFGMFFDRSVRHIPLSRLSSQLAVSLRKK